MMVAAGGKKEGPGITPHHLVESQSLVIEGLSLIDVGDVEMDMTHDRSPRYPAPALAIRGRDKARHVERIRRHRQLAILVLPPAAGTVGVNFNAESVRIGEIQRFAHEVVGHSGVDAM